MEPAGLAVGAVGLAGLFSACVDCFELVQLGRYLGRGYLLLETKFANQRLRLVTWGQACGIMDPRVYDTRLEDPELKERLEDSLNHIMLLFKDGKELRRKYGLKSETGPPKLLLASQQTVQTINTLANSTWTPTSISQRLQDFTNRVERTQKQASLTSTARWAIEDKKKFTELVQNMKDLIDDLEGLTKHLGIDRRQRDNIRAKVDSINEISTLEAMEKARLGNHDAISDAASLRLWTLRDHHLLTQRPEETQVSLNSIVSDEWEVLENDGVTAEQNLPSQDAADTSLNFQILHEVHCYTLDSRRLFLDPPTYHSGQHDTENWAVLDPEYSTHDSRSQHLTGTRCLVSLDAYTKQNSILDFLVLKRYSCCGDDSSGVSGVAQDTAESIRLQSAEFCDVLEEFYNSKRTTCQLRTFQPNTELKAPYLWFYHEKENLISVADSPSGEKYGRLRPLFETIQRSMSLDYDVVDGLLSSKHITWSHLHYLFIPGEVLFQPDERCGLEVRDYCKPCDATDGDIGVEIPVSFWNYDEVFRKEHKIFYLGRNVFRNKIDFKVDIRSLPIFPLRYNWSLRIELEVSGTMFWSMRGPRLMSYSGPDADPDSHEQLNGRFMIDFAAHKRSLQQDIHTPNRTEPKFTAMDTVEHVGQIPNGNFVLLLPSAIFGYDLQSNKWHKLFPAYLQPVTWNKSAFESLALEQKTKVMIQALCMSGTRGGEKNSRRDLNILRGGNRNSVILFHGSPGTGKTFAAESVAEMTEKPLQIINIANMGVKVAEMDRMMRHVLSTAAIWDPVILFDHADVLLKQGSASDLSRNATVTAFLRILDDLRGIVIFTVNRVTVLDEAIERRIHLLARLKDLDAEQRRLIWRNLIGLAENQGMAIDVKGLKGRLDDLSRVKINGRQIRNVLTAALRLASFEGTAMGYEEVTRIMESQMYSGALEGWLSPPRS